MKARDIVVAAIIIALIGGAVYLSQKKQSEELTETSGTPSTEQQLEEKFNVKIPEGVEKAELSDVSGGNSSGIATRKFENETFSLTILADLPDTEQGGFYQGWLERGDEDSEDYSLIPAGKMKLAKGGWMLNFESSTDYSDYNQVIVSSESVSDNNLEEPILEGSF